MTASGRDRMDAAIDDWRRELPDFDRPEFEVAKRAVRLERIRAAHPAGENSAQTRWYDSSEFDPVGWV
jgi:hypothetical protein